MTDTENRFYIYEALRMWNCLTATWKTDWSFNFNTGTTLHGSTPAPDFQAIPLLVYSKSLWTALSDDAVPFSAASFREVWTGTTQFQMVDLIGAVNRHRAEFNSRQLAIRSSSIFQRSDSRAAVLRTRYLRSSERDGYLLSRPMDRL